MLPFHAALIITFASTTKSHGDLRLLQMHSLYSCIAELLQAEGCVYLWNPVRRAGNVKEERCNRETGNFTRDVGVNFPSV